MVIPKINGGGKGTLSRMRPSTTNLYRILLLPVIGGCFLPFAWAGTNASIVAFSGTPLRTASAPLRAAAPSASVRTGLQRQMRETMRSMSRLYGIPAGLMRAISLVESGIHHAPWPWTLNVYGTAYRYRSAAATSAAVHRFLNQGITVVDIGPMQVDWQYHHRFFQRVRSAVNPLTNISEAARILRADYRKTGSWSDAVGLYHGGGAQRQQGYIRNVLHHWTARNRTTSLAGTIMVPHLESAALTHTHAIVAIQGATAPAGKPS